MKHLILLTAALLLSLSVSAINHTLTAQKAARTKKLNITTLDRRSIMPLHSDSHATTLRLQCIKRHAEEAQEDSFIFDPVGAERLYCMSDYSYDQNNQKFVHATSLKSQVRYDSDGKTVYFKDLLPSLGVKTWVKGTIDGDTIRVTYGQPLAYYRSQYLIFLCPMLYNDSTGNMEVQDELKYIIRGDSIMAPTYTDGIFQCAAGYVYVSEKTQGSLSYDLDHQMRELKEKSITAPTDAEAQEYIMTYENSAEKISKTKVHIKQKGDDIYMQLSTSAPEAYIHGQMKGDSIQVPSLQMITDSTFIYYYSLSLPVYNDTTGIIQDFYPAPDGNCYLHLNPTTHVITATHDLFGADYMDGLEICMDYTCNMRLDPYAGDHPVRPINPTWRSINLGADVYQPYISFNIPNLDVDSNYINTDKITYSLFFDLDADTLTSEDVNDYVYPLEHDNYMNIATTQTAIPYSFYDGYDFFVYGSLHYVYIYEKLFNNIGVQTIYTVDGVEHRSDVIVYNMDTEQTSIVPMKDTGTIVTGISSTQTNGTNDRTEGFNLAGQRVGKGYKGIIVRNGRKVILHN